MTIENFRNIEAADVTFSPGVNLLYGDNAQGKTNLLEAIYYTALGKSFRPAKDAELIRFGAPRARIVNTFEDDVREQRLAVTLATGRGRRLVEQNGVKIGKMSEMVGAFRVVLFCPEHLSIIQGSPELRRAFLNVALSQLRPLYLTALQRYNRILKERNSLLKKAPEDPGLFRETEPLWSAQLAEEAAVIADYRDRYVTLANTYVRACFADMTAYSRDGQAVATDAPDPSGRAEEIPELTYVNSLGITGDELRDREKTAARYLELLSTRHEREIGAGATLYGIHKDDIRITLDGRPARLYASQGQQRSLALAMKLAEGDISADASGGDRPVFLFDDVLSELDGHRRAYLMQRLTGRQVILTACDPAAAEGGVGVHMIRVRQGGYEA